MADEQVKKDSAGSDDLDVSLEPVSRKKGGCGWGVVITILLIVAAAAVVGIAWWRSEQRAAERKAAEETRVLTQEKVGSDLINAAALVRAGDLKAGVKAMDDASLALAGLIQEAEEAKDTEAAEALNLQKVALDGAKKKLAEQQQAVDAILAEAATAIEAQASTVSGGKARPQPPAPAEGEPAATPPAPAPEGALPAPAPVEPPPPPAAAPAPGPEAAPPVPPPAAPPPPPPPPPPA